MYFSFSTDAGASLLTLMTSMDGTLASTCRASDGVDCDLASNSVLHALSHMNQ
jgi:hypothetical protein